MDTIALTTIISLSTGILGFLIAYFTFQRNKKKDDRADGVNIGVVTSDIGYIKAGVDDLKQENRELRSTNVAFSERLTRVEESDKSAHKRINELHDLLEKKE